MKDNNTNNFLCFWFLFVVMVVCLTSNNEDETTESTTIYEASELSETSEIYELSGTSEIFETSETFEITETSEITASETVDVDFEDEDLVSLIFKNEAGVYWEADEETVFYEDCYLSKRIDTGIRFISGEGAPIDLDNGNEVYGYLSQEYGLVWCKECVELHETNTQIESEPEIVEEDEDLVDLIFHNEDGCYYEPYEDEFFEKADFYEDCYLSQRIDEEIKFISSTVAMIDLDNGNVVWSYLSEEYGLIWSAKYVPLIETED